MVKKRARTERRRLERELRDLGDAREKLARLSEGGTPERPIEVTSASVVEARATSLGCGRCEGDVRVEDHAAVTTASGALRCVRLRCKDCHAARDVWVRFAEKLLS